MTCFMVLAANGMATSAFGQAIRWNPNRVAPFGSPRGTYGALVSTTDTGACLEYAARAAQITGDETVIRLFYVGEAVDIPVMSMPETPGVRFEIESRPGDVVAEILTEAGKTVDLIVMSTAGHEGFLDALRGSVTEQVLRHSPCPLLAVPAT